MTEYEPTNPAHRTSRTVNPIATDRKGRSFLVQLAIMVLTTIMLSAVFMAFIVRAYEVDGSSMETTLQNGDRLLVWKAGKSWANLRNQDYSLSRWDIIVFDRPENDLGLNEEVGHLIKRVIGLPGERVVVSDGSVTVYNDQNPDGFSPDEGQDYAKSFDYTNGNSDVIVGDGEVFVLGDNRSNSTDSRIFGAIESSSITGTAELRIAPVNKFESF